ncbi:hypothetical protein LTR62_002760 [Meristemomyces frigidus]|uniref:UBR-type domain-containing protein n=1 Tax=Meristemomyces frigidus TaxID=1508187 RepID=A0AAN7TQV3_9PEZI|nr:hypothetical protein LTR62_002760 [Meristemomyces frigidus]
MTAMAATGSPGTNTNNHDNKHSSQTAQDFIATQLQLEADAREALPYQFDTCTKPLGPLRQSIFACLTCTPPPPPPPPPPPSSSLPASPPQQSTHVPAGICYSCSISCHGDHTLVELFAKRDFECDCGSTRFAQSGSACELRSNAVTGRKGGVVGEQAREGNKYNHNFQGRFCGCGEEYDPENEKGTMFQCLGLGTVEQGGCGEDWWHPECLMGLPRTAVEVAKQGNGVLETVKEEDGEEGAVADEIAVGEEAADHETHAEIPLPAGFPPEDDFDYLLCYKCVNAFPWIKQYAGTPGFLSAVEFKPVARNGDNNTAAASTTCESQTKKRRSNNDNDESDEAQDSKKARMDSPSAITATTTATAPAAKPNNAAPPRHTTLPPPPPSNPPISLFLTPDFRANLCHCPTCFPHLIPHPHLLEEEETYSPPISESSSTAPHAHAAPSLSGRSAGTGSLLERGEAALSSMDRVRAIEGVMAYNHVRDKVKDFLKPFAESGKVVGAEDIKAYFAQLRGDEGREGEEMAGAGAHGGGVEGDGRREQKG